jgi:hypothetical protein
MPSLGVIFRLVSFTGISGNRRRGTRLAD